MSHNYSICTPSASLARIEQPKDRRRAGAPDDVSRSRQSRAWRPIEASMRVYADPAGQAGGWSFGWACMPSIKSWTCLGN
jgi:hypothetical protein